ncbi:MAG TPA: hypothetical protein VNG32_01110 [Candidatus Dormibacteraeota bacterium]|nr:hypothetical protein [Candidatus Dormibacteraeota bacterium]
MPTQEIAPVASPEEVALSGETPGQPVAFKTAQGSVYKYDDEGKTTRFKTATGEQKERQDITVFVPLTLEEEQDYLEAYQGDFVSTQKIYVVERQPDDSARIVRDIGQVTNPDEIYLAITEDGQIVKNNKASVAPVVGANVFDTRQFRQDGQTFTERHLGNKVAEIAYQ